MNFYKSTYTQWQHSLPTNDNIHSYKWQHPLLAMKYTLTKMESPSTLSEKLRVWRFCLKFSQVLKSCFGHVLGHLLVSQTKVKWGTSHFCSPTNRWISSQVRAGFKPNLGKGLWYPKLFPIPPFFLFEYMKHRKFLWCFWSWRKP